MKTFPDIDRLKATVDPHPPLDPAIVRNLREDLIVRWTYHSNAIEGNPFARSRRSLPLPLSRSQPPRSPRRPR
jgi:hypothetical protein